MLAFAACQIYAGIRYGLPVACVVGGCLAGACIGILGNIHKADKWNPKKQNLEDLEYAGPTVPSLCAYNSHLLQSNLA